MLLVLNVSLIGMRSTSHYPLGGTLPEFALMLFHLLLDELFVAWEAAINSSGVFARVDRSLGSAISGSQKTWEK